MTCLLNNPAQFITITLGVFLGRFAYDLVALAIVRDKPEALAGSLRAVARCRSAWAGPPHPARPTAPVACVRGADDSVRDRFSPAHTAISDVRSPIE
jgi:hypothetical protein